ncbi:MAG: biotin carboxylase, partial [Actinomycetota bacterium]
MLSGLSDIYRFFRENPTPVYFVSPTAYNLLGLDDWVSSFRYICYFDSFDGEHDHVFVPTHPGPREFDTFESVNTYLLGHKEVVDYVGSRDPGYVLFVMFDEETEQRALDLGLTIALPPRELRQRIDSKIETTRLGNEAGVPSAPNILTECSSYDDLLAQAAA